MEVTKCNTKVAMETKARNLNTKSKMDESRFARFYEHKDLDRELQMSYAEVGRKDGFFYNFVENLTNKKLYDRSCIL